MQIDILEGQFVGEAETHHDHAGYPEEEDVGASLEQVPREEGLHVGVLVVGPAHGGEGEEPRGEPGVQHVLVLGQLNARNVHIEFLCSIFSCFLLIPPNYVVVIILSVWVVDDSSNLDEVSRDSVSPPELPGHTPVLDLVEPVKPGLLVVLWDDYQLLGADGIAGPLGDVLAVNIPLGLQEGLDDVVRAGTQTKSHFVRALTSDQTHFF